MKTENINIAHFAGEVFVKIGTKIAKVPSDDVPRLIDAIREAQRLALEYKEKARLTLMVKG